MNRLRQAALCLLPVAVFLWLDWYGLRAWFQNDDFAWLAQDLSLNGWRDWLKALFEPRAQGTLRVLSERVCFSWRCTGWPGWTTVRITLWWP